MTWNHRSRIAIVGIAIQPTPGTFVQPGVNDLLAVSAPANADEMISADDPTLTGGMFASPRVYLGRVGTAGATFPLRGFSGALPAANANVWGRILQAFGFAEIRQGADVTAEVLQAGSTTNSLVLATTRPSTDDQLIGVPISQASLGAGFQSYTMISDYVGASRTAVIPETVVAPAAGAAYTIPAHLLYQLGTLATEPTLLSISVWRDKKRYDYRDCRGTTLNFDLPVANEQNQVFPSCDFALRGNKHAVVDDPAPIVPQSQLSVGIPVLRGGKFVLDRVKLGHASIRAGLDLDVAAASNANQAAGQDGYTTTGATRRVETDLNQMNVTDFDIDTRIDNQTLMSMFTSWGSSTFNRFGFLVPEMSLDPHNPGDRNGFVNLTGAANPTQVDKSMALAVW
jgi:hypothetical protein